jgi:hypothetical protein
MTADPMLAEGFVVLVPFAPLMKGAAYTVNFAATLRSGDVSVAKAWNFVPDRDR